jgi:hypothetical protein
MLMYTCMHVCCLLTLQAKEDLAQVTAERDNLKKDVAHYRFHLDELRDMGMANIREVSIQHCIYTLSYTLCALSKVYACMHKHSFSLPAVCDCSCECAAMSASKHYTVKCIDVLTH